MTTLSPMMGKDITATNHEEFVEAIEKKYAFAATPRAFVPHYPMGKLGGKFGQVKPQAGPLDRAETYNRTAYEIVQHEYIWTSDDHTTKCDQIPKSPKDAFLRRLNDVLSWTPKSLARMHIVPLMQIPKGGAVVKAYTSELFKELRESVRAVDETPMPCANMDGTSPKPKSLREFARVNDLAYPAIKTEQAWYMQNPRPWDVLDNSFMLMRAHYNRVAPNAFLRYLGSEYAVSKNDYVKWFSKVSVSMFTKYADNREVLVCGVDNYMDTPIEQFDDGSRVNPVRGAADIDFKGLNPQDMTMREKAWWSGEIYRLNIRKDGMRRVRGLMAKTIGAYFGVSYRTVETNASKNKPLTASRKKDEVAIVAPSEHGSGFKGISGDWVVNYKPATKSKWTPPWENDY